MRDALPGDGLSGSHFRANLTYSDYSDSIPLMVVGGAVTAQPEG